MGIRSLPVAAAAYEFGPFRFEPRESRLLREGTPVPLPPQGIETLQALVEKGGCLVTKRELMDRVWPGRFVEENSLTKCVSALRAALGDQRAGPSYIETVAKRGYRFIAQVRPQDRGGEPSGSARDLRRRSTRDVDAYRLYREARCHVLRYTSAAWRKSAIRYEAAIAQDPAYALAHADLAISSVLACVYYTSSETVAQRAREAARQALAIDSGLAEAHLATALVRLFLDWNWQGAESSFHQALAFDPAQAWSHNYYGTFLCLMGRFREALPTLERAVELNPVRLAVNGHLGLYHHFTGTAEGSLGHYRRALDLDPFCGLIRVDLARTLELAGRPREALAEIERAQQLDDAPWVRVWLARALALAGEPEGARRILGQLGQGAWRGSVSPVFLALVHAALGDREEALAQLEEARAQRSPWIAFLGVEPGFDSLREEPGFAALLRRTGLTA